MRARRVASGLFPGRFRLNVLDGVRTVREFDNVITAPYGGYRDAADYYQQASAARVLRQVSVPTLIVTAKDDPLVAGNMAMLEATEREGMVFGTGWDAAGIWNYFASFYGHA